MEDDGESDDDVGGGDDRSGTSRRGHKLLVLKQWLCAKFTHGEGSVSASDAKQVGQLLLVGWFICLVGWSHPYKVGQLLLVGWFICLVGWSHPYKVGQLLLVGWFICLVGWSRPYKVGQLRLVGWFICLVGWSHLCKKLIDLFRFSVCFSLSQLSASNQHKKLGLGSQCVSLVTSS